MTTIITTTTTTHHNRRHNRRHIYRLQDYRNARHVFNRIPTSFCIDSA